MIQRPLSGISNQQTRLPSINPLLGVQRNSSQPCNVVIPPIVPRNNDTLSNLLSSSNPKMNPVNPTRALVRPPLPQKTSPHTPFRPQGRGSKQLTKALSQHYDDADHTQIEAYSEWVLCKSEPVCFAKVLSGEASGKTMIQPFKLSSIDPSLLVLWEGHVWLAKSSNLIPVQVSSNFYCLSGLINLINTYFQFQMKREALGYRVQMTKTLSRWIDKLTKAGIRSSYPISFQTAMKNQTEDWDMVSLESSELDDSSSIFPMLQNPSRMQGYADNANMKTLPPLIPNVNEQYYDDSMMKRAESEASDRCILPPITPKSSSNINTNVSDSKPALPINITFSSPSCDTPATTDSEETMSCVRESDDDSYSANDVTCSFLSDKSPSADDNSEECDTPKRDQPNFTFSTPIDEEELYFPSDCPDISYSDLSFEESQPVNKIQPEDKDSVNIDDIENIADNSDPRYRSPKRTLSAIFSENSKTDGIALSSETRSEKKVIKKRQKKTNDESVSMKPPRPVRKKSVSYHDRQVIFGSWVSRTQCAANGSWNI